VLLAAGALALYSPDPQVSRLLVAFWLTRPDVCGEDVGPSERADLVEQLGRLPGDAPRRALLRLLRWHLLVGPRVRDHIWRDADYTGVLHAGLVGLTRWADDPAVLALAGSLADGKRWYPHTDWSIEAQAHRILLLHEMRQSGVNSNETAVTYLAGQVSGTGMGHAHDWARPGLLTNSSARNVAIGELLKDYDTTAAPALREALRNTPPTDERRRDALQQYLREIEKIRPRLEQLQHGAAPRPDRGLRR